jgi:intein-encoded DNA endonuclease-like protein
MQIEMKEIEELAEKLNLSKEEMIRESLRSFLERKLREIKTEIFKIRTKYGVSLVEEFEEKYKNGEIEEKETWQDLQRLDHLEFKKDELEKALRTL